MPSNDRRRDDSCCHAGCRSRPPEGRHGRRDEHAAGAFDEVLGAPKTPHRAETGASAKPKTDAWRQAGTRLGAGSAALDTAIAKDGHRATNMIDATPVRGLAGSLDQPDDGSADNTDPAEAGADDGLPTQMRAEQAISAIMTIAPIARQSAPSIGHHGARTGRRGSGRRRWRNHPAEAARKPASPPAQSSGWSNRPRPGSKYQAGTPQPGTAPSHRPSAQTPTVQSVSAAGHHGEGARQRQGGRGKAGRSAGQAGRVRGCGNGEIDRRRCLARSGPAAAATAPMPGKAGRKAAMLRANSGAASRFRPLARFR